MVTPALATQEPPAVGPLGRLALATLVGLLASLLVLGAALAAESVWIKPRARRARVERRDRRVQAARDAGVGQDEFWKATLWEEPTAARQASLALLLTLPATLGAVVAGRLLRSRAVLAAALAVGGYVFVALLPLSGVSAGDGPAYPLSELQWLPGSLLVVGGGTLLVALPLLSASWVSGRSDRFRHR